MKITIDTNVLVRLATEDNPAQLQSAAKALRSAEMVFVSLHCICELVWVLRSGYGFSSARTITAIVHLLESSNVAVDRQAVEAGLQHMRQGGDFADGLIAYQGRWFGAEQFLSFDRRAVSLLQAQGFAARLLK